MPRYEQMNHDMEANDPKDFINLDLTHVYDEHDSFFSNVDNSKSAIAKRKALRNTYFGGYSDKMSARKSTYNAQDARQYAAVKKDMNNREVSNGFLEMDGDNPMMAYANEVSENVDDPPYFETHINESSHGSNIANVSQHTFVRFHATVYNRELRRVVRYVFAIGHHQRGLLNDYHIPSTIAMRKQVTYSDVKKGFAFINRYRMNRNEDWKLFTTNCNKFAKSVAESMGFQDMASLHDTVSCVGSFKKIREAMYNQLASKNSDLQFFSNEQFKRSEVVAAGIRDREGMERPGDIQANLGMARMMKMMRESNLMGFHMDLTAALEGLVGNALKKDLKITDVEDLRNVRDEYNKDAGQGKFIWFKKKKQRKIAIYEAYRSMKEYLELLTNRDGNEYVRYFKDLREQVEDGLVSKEEYAKEKDLLRASVYNNLLDMTDVLILATKGLKETSAKALSLKGNIMGYKSLITNDGDVSIIARKGFGNYHAHAMDQLMEDGLDAGINYNDNDKITREDTLAGQVGLKIATADKAKENEKTLAAYGHFILQRILKNEGEWITKLSWDEYLMKHPFARVAAVFEDIKKTLENGGGENQKLKDYMAMLIVKGASYTGSSEAMAWTMVQFIIKAVKNLFEINMNDTNAVGTRTDILDAFDKIYERRSMQSVERMAADSYEDRTRFEIDQFFGDYNAETKAEMEKIREYINRINDVLKDYADAVMGHGHA